MKSPLANQAARKTVSTFRRTSSLGTLFGQRICPLFLAGALLVAPGAAQADDVILDFDTFLSNGGLTFGPGDTFIIKEGVTVETTDLEGVFAWGLDGVTVINNGTIRTFGDYIYNAATGVNGYGDGIFIAESAYATAINNGWISISDNFANGIYAYNIGDGFTGINNGTIVIEREAGQENLEGSGGTTVLLDPNGDAYITSNASAGIRVDAYDALSNPSTGHLVVNNGVIRSYVLQSRGMFLDGSDGGTYLSIDSTMINNGLIEMLSEDPSSGIFDVDGMRIEGHNGTQINNGVIRVLPRGFGIQNNGAGGTVLNFGEIYIDGENIAGAPSYGIENYRNGGGISDAETNLTVNAGKIHATGPTTHGVMVSGHANHHVVNYGSIISEQGFSIVFRPPVNDVDGTTSPNMLSLLDGSVLYGDVFVGSAAHPNTSLRLGDGLNAAVRFASENHVFDVFSDETGTLNTNTWTPGGIPDDILAKNGYVIVDNTLYVVDLDSYVQQDQVSWSMFSAIQDAVDDGTTLNRPSGSFAFHDHDKDDGFEMWATMFADFVYDPGDDVDYADPTGDHTAGYTGYSAGTIVGVNTDLLSLYLGAAYSDVDSDEDVNYETYSGTVFGGVAATLAERFKVSVTAGASYNRTERDMADNTVSGGIDTASADYTSVFLSPSLLVRGPIGSSLRLNYLGGWHQAHDFDFSGGTQLDVDSRYSNVFGAQLQMMHTLPVTTLPFTETTLRTRFRYGVEASYATGDAIGYNLMGTDFDMSYDDGFEAGGYAALELGPTYFKAGFNSEEQVSLNAGLTLRF